MFNLSPETILVKISTRILAAANSDTFKNLKTIKLTITLIWWSYMKPYMLHK